MIQPATAIDLIDYSIEEVARATVEPWDDLLRRYDPETVVCGCDHGRSWGITSTISRAVHIVWHEVVGLPTYRVSNHGVASRGGLKEFTHAHVPEEIIKHPGHRIDVAVDRRAERRVHPSRVDARYYPHEAHQHPPTSGRPWPIVPSGNVVEDSLVPVHHVIALQSPLGQGVIQYCLIGRDHPQMRKEWRDHIAHISPQLKVAFSM